MPEPSGSTGALPSAEAIEAAGATLREGWPHFVHSDGSARDVERAEVVGAPAIAREAHAAGVQEGRAAMLREVVGWLRSSPSCPRPGYPELARAIEAHFSGEGTT